MQGKKSYEALNVPLVFLSLGSRAGKSTSKPGEEEGGYLSQDGGANNDHYNNSPYGDGGGYGGHDNGSHYMGGH